MREDHVFVAEAAEALNAYADGWITRNEWEVRHAAAVERHEARKREARNARARAARQARNEAMRSIGMVKVRGALGGTYWE